MQVFKTQTALVDFAYERTRGDRMAMLDIIVKHMKSGSVPFKPHQREKLEQGGEKAYKAYAKVKIREYWKRHVAEKPQAHHIPAPQPSNVIDMFSWKRAN